MRIEPGTALEQVTTYTLDAFGNRTAVSVSGPGVSARTATTTYDARGRFPVGSTNALGHTETRTFDARFGTVLSHTGPNGRTTTWQVDRFGRTVLETRPDATTTATQYLDCAGGCPTGAVRQVRVTASGIAPVTTSFDLLGREVRTQTLGFGAREVVQDTEYDALGRVARTSVPSYTGDPVYWTRNTYDLMDRVVTVTAPDDTLTTTAYAGYTTTVTNALGQTTTRLINSLRPAAARHRLTRRRGHLHLRRAGESEDRHRPGR